MWLVGLPAWGERYIETLTSLTIPSLLACEKPDMPIHVIAHTDQPDIVHTALEGISHEVKPVLYVDGKISYSSMSAAHEDVMHTSRPGDYVTMMCADVIFSKECFVAAEKRFKEGYRAVACTGMRTIGPLFGNPPPIGVSSSELLQWATVHRHPIITQCFWPFGQSPTPSQLYFDSDDGVVARVFTPCLFAVMNDRNLHFTGTIDRDLLECFSHSEIHLVTSKDEMAVVEVSPLHKSFGFTKHPMTAKSIGEWVKYVKLNPLHLWFFGQRIEVTGKGDGHDIKIAEDILREAV
jgi:hypothetical protein